MQPARERPQAVGKTVALLEIGGNCQKMKMDAEATGRLGGAAKG
jgi:hypothetical protein